MLNWLRRKVALWLEPAFQALREERTRVQYDAFFARLQPDPSPRQFLDKQWDPFFTFQPRFRISRGGGARPPESA
jgi:hypothetical protein